MEYIIGIAVFAIIVGIVAYNILSSRLDRYYDSIQAQLDSSMQYNSERFNTMYRNIERTKDMVYAQKEQANAELVKNSAQKSKAKPRPETISAYKLHPAPSKSQVTSSESNHSRNSSQSTDDTIYTTSLMHAAYVTTDSTNYDTHTGSRGSCSSSSDSSPSSSSSDSSPSSSYSDSSSSYSCSDSSSSSSSFD